MCVVVGIRLFLYTYTYTEHTQLYKTVEEKIIFIFILFLCVRKIVHKIKLIYWELQGNIRQ